MSGSLTSVVVKLSRAGRVWKHEWYCVGISI